MSPNLRKFRENLDALDDAPMMCKPEIAQAALENAFHVLQNIEERQNILLAKLENRGCNAAS